MIKPISFNRTFNRHANISFGTSYDNLEKNKLGYNCANYTCMYREDINWDLLSDYIIKDGNPKKIYCYACSDGSEPYSLAIALIEKLRYKEAQRYFSIIARDIDEGTITKAKKGYLKLEKKDFPRIRRFCEPDKYFKFIRCIRSTPFLNGIYKVKKELFNCIDFETGDISKDSEFLNYENSLILLRNVFMYMPYDVKEKITNNFMNNFRESTALVTGTLDKIPCLQRIPERNRIPVYNDSYYRSK